MKPFQNVGQPFLITGQPPEAAQPAKVAFDHPPARQQHKAPLDVGQLDDLQRDAVVGCRLLGGLAGRRLDSRRQLGDLRPVLGVGGRDVQCQQLAQRIDRQMDLAALAPLSGILCIVRLSRMIALGWGVRPSPRRISWRRSARIVVKTSASIQRRVCW